MTTIAVTGATGFVGGRLVAYFASQGHTVLAFGRRAAADWPPGVSYTAWDITTVPLPVHEDIDVVIHCAGSIADWGAYPEMYAANVTGTQHVLAAFRRARQFIHVSSSSVYDPFVPKVRIREDAPPATRYLNAYGATKALAEQVVLQSAHPNRAIVRPRAVYGPGDTSLLPRLLRAKKFGRFLVLGDGHNEISLTHIDNFCDLIGLMVGRELDGEIFNVADARSGRIDDIMTAFVAAMGLGVPLLHVPTPLAQGLAHVLLRTNATLRRRAPPFITPFAVNQLVSPCTLDISKARQRLGYDPQRDYDQGFRELRAWLDQRQEHGSGSRSVG